MNHADSGAAIRCLTFGADGDFGGETRDACRRSSAELDSPGTTRPAAATIAALQAAVEGRQSAPVGPAVNLPAFPKPIARRTKG